ncbi:putative transcriptional regulator protein [Indibacter alkaliphilus LW1]|uniref:Transcriptional regulator protein n=1 Tax=Indibacter alkaliphilus (strain CCUG 57479 / KCTC 22604 / LW1) TaxID=1189612 RepID=S2DKG9_INDAL|nr:MerR family transcriptional regulator [Indibacter alkaliphilus]EOZ97720.1 putative transcriptional regulator protein [Indibacter alkaliphilus LW1]
MPYKEKEIEKKYYSIGEVASMFKVAPSLIRYWEGEFDIIRPKKDKKGNRRFTKDDIEKIRYIYQLVKIKGYTLQGAQEVIKGSKEKVYDKAVMVDRLHQIKRFLIEIRDTMHVNSDQ